MREGDREMSRSHWLAAVVVVLVGLFVAPVGALARGGGAVDRLLARLDSTVDRFDAKADRIVDGAIRRALRLERAGASDDAIRAVLAQAEASVDALGAALRADLDRIETAALGVVDRQESFDAQRPATPRADFEGLRRRVESATDNQNARVDRLLIDVSERLDAAAPVEEMPEEFF